MATKMPLYPKAFRAYLEFDKQLDEKTTNDIRALKYPCELSVLGIRWIRGGLAQDIEKQVVQIITEILKPRGYIANGSFEIHNDTDDNYFLMTVEDNVIKTFRVHVNCFMENVYGEKGSSVNNDYKDYRDYSDYLTRNHFC